MGASLFATTATRDSFSVRVERAVGEPLTGRTLDTIQVNVGLKCNLACRHCHVESSPKRNEEMSWETMQAVLYVARLSGAHTLDITGGAPEMHPLLPEFVETAFAQGLNVIVRTNLTVMLQNRYNHFPKFFADRDVHLIASLPCYLPENVDKQRGRNVYHDSIAVVQRLNELGYGTSKGKLLDFIYNPGGPNLPPPERSLEDDYKRVLYSEYGIRFNRLYAMTNVAIGRFLRDLARDGNAAAYRQLLRESFNPGTVEGLMCRHQLHVGFDGAVYDCDFNFALGLPADGRQNVRDVDPESFRRRRIVTGEHCFACTAGCGSSCGGALVNADSSCTTAQQ